MRKIEILRMALNDIEEEKYGYPPLPSSVEHLEFSPISNIAGMNLIPHVDKDKKYVKKFVVGPYHQPDKAFTSRPDIEAVRQRKPTRRYAVREVVASQIGRLMGLNIPEIKMLKEEEEGDKKKNKYTLLTHYIPGKSLHESIKITGVPSSLLSVMQEQPTGTIKRPTNEERSEVYENDLKNKFNSLNPSSIIKTALFNWLIKHRDTHTNNMRITPNNELVPIDYEASFHQAADELPLFEHKNYILHNYLRPNHSKKLDKSVLKKIIDNKDKILHIVKNRLLPEYDTEHDRQQAYLDVFRKLDTIQDLYNKDAPTYGDLNLALTGFSIPTGRPLTLPARRVSELEPEILGVTPFSQRLP